MTTKANYSLQHIAQRPEFIPQLASWFDHEWASFNPELTIQARCRDLILRTDHKKLPLTMIATKDDKLLGTYSLDLEDLAIRPELTPWLASVFVNPKNRHQGLGTWLVKQAMLQAQSLGINTLYLFTTDQSGWYASMGWQNVEDLDYKKQNITLMQFKT